MSKKGATGLTPCVSHMPEQSQAKAAIKNIHNQNNPKLVSEICALHMMDELIGAYRKDILRLRKEYKELRNQESMQELVNLHIRHKLKTMDETIQRSLESYTALREDFFVQRSCLLKETEHTQNKA